MFKEIADIQTAETLKLPVPKANRKTIVVKPSDIQKAMVKGLGERAERIRKKPNSYSSLAHAFTSNLLPSKPIY